MATSPIDYAAMLNGNYGGGSAPQNPGLSPQGMYPATVYNPDWSSTDPTKQFSQNRTYEAAWGNQMDSSLAGQQNYADQLENYYRAPMDTAAGQLGNTPGYTTDELGNITRAPQYQSGVTTPDQYSSMAPTAAQSAAMRGDPNSLMNAYNPQAILNSAGNASTGMAQANQFGQLSENAAIHGAQTQLQGPYLAAIQNAFGGYQNQIGSDTSASNSNLNLNLNPQDYLMGNQEKQNIINQAGQSVQTGRSAYMDQISRAAAASGNADPMALAALSNQTMAQGNEGAAEAQTNAYLAANAQQRGLAMNYAQAKLGAGQTQVGMDVGAQQNLMANQFGQANNYEQMNLGLTGQQVSALQNQNANQLQAQQYGGQLGLSANEYAQTTGENLAANVNNLNTTYGNQQYQNQLQNQMYGQQNTFNQNTAVQDRQSAAYQAAANARMGGQNQFLNWATGQTGQAVQQGQTATQQRIGAAGQTFGDINQNTAGSANYQLAKSGQPNWFDKTIGAVAGGLSGYAKASAAAGG